MRRRRASGPTRPARPGLLGAPAGAARLDLDAGDAAAAGARAARSGSAVPVICVGNLTAGGAGKTPTVIALVERLRARGVAAHVVSRGHGGSLAGPVRVEERRHTRGRGRRRAAAPRRLRAGLGRRATAPPPAAPRRRPGAGAVVMDDGLQNPGARQGSVDRRGRRRLRLRQRPGDAGRAAARAGGRRTGPRRSRCSPSASRRSGRASAPPGRRRRAAAARRRARAASAPAWTGAALRAFAFAGIGRPEKFFATLRALGAELVAAHAASPTTRPTRRGLLARLEAEARGRRAPSWSPPRRTPPGCRRPSAARCWCCRSGWTSRTGRRSTRRWRGSASGADIR